MRRSIALRELIASASGKGNRGLKMTSRPGVVRAASERTHLPSGAIIAAAGALAVHFAEAMSVYFAVAIGSALGGVARFWCSGLAARLLGETFPWGTLIVNVVGSFIIGSFSTLTGPDGRMFVGSTARQFVMIGICGGYTTFSSFSLQTLDLMKDGEWLQASTNIGGSIVLCLVAVWAGHALAVALNGMKLT
jgi:fluoride exporter